MCLPRRPANTHLPSGESCSSGQPRIPVAFRGSRQRPSKPTEGVRSAVSRRGLSPGRACRASIALVACGCNGEWSLVLRLSLLGPISLSIYPAESCRSTGPSHIVLGLGGSTPGRNRFVNPLAYILDNTKSATDFVLAIGSWRCAGVDANARSDTRMIECCVPIPPAPAEACLCGSSGLQRSQIINHGTTMRDAKDAQAVSNGGQDRGLVLDAHRRARQPPPFRRRAYTGERLHSDQPAPSHNEP
ncbi:hypothetical protein N658DRAFT_107306 [Parathielavia hyrcaniae]|uniref:Uncharacterized protein n=1 Tax=Parathielavia hyrcaniae TaxID=113614 RepID=A0AAN6Q024_9PEZI|nr:hypothetical protein N658DRAFT_107306 [Parathielavia hyrcaniae]